MNNRENLNIEIKKFLENNAEKIMLITGTHQYEKHIELLKTLSKYEEDGTKVLFRLNGKDNIETIFNNKIKSAKLNTRIKIGNIQMYIDTINNRTWRNDKYDVSIIYPIDPLCRMNDRKREEIINNLLRNNVNKLFIVSWTDNYDYTWLNEFGVDRIAVFDAEEEDKAYHSRVLECINKNNWR
ncbi:hypothetical protein [Paraclostridium dentum]|uniref:hypothetical protein n=1 Tax=Paraclostridium dentum TaxID=2662455 RepID=UPI0014728C44|nr:hypothetical protein [Paraclostridium dentum]